MKLNFTLWLSILALFFTLLSCEDHRIPQGQRFRIKKTTHTYRRDYSSVVYNYNSNGQIANYVSYFGTSPAIENSSGTTTVLDYDAQGRVVKAETQFNLHNISALLYRCIYEYDASGNISVVSYYSTTNNSSLFTLIEEFRLEYAGTKFPVKQTTITGIGQFVEQYTYSGGNIVKIERSDNIGGTYTPQTLQYDDKPNPFYGLITGPPSINIFSKNNAVASHISYTYDSTGLLTKVVLPISGVGDDIDTFEYEAY